ncbi:hypothetical protein CFP56_035783 [Quercus suber]|uniref:Uncharacterized protein n=1 Tax=Quercus suber TaxID=58331 RepID=A0AAW0LPX8_QUESU
MLALKQTGLLSILFAYFVPIIFIVIAIWMAVVLFKIIERLAFILCWACECNVGGAPPISSIPLSALGVLDGDGLCSSSVKESL